MLCLHHGTCASITGLEYQEIASAGVMWLTGLEGNSTHWMEQR